MSPEAKKRVIAVSCGFGGGLAPFLVNLAQGLVGQSKLPVDLNVSYFVGVLLFGLIGASVPLIFSEVDPRKAFFLGVGAPAMISLAVKDVKKGGETSSTMTPSHFALIASAFAQAPPTPAATLLVRTLQIELSGTMAEATVVFQDGGGRELKASTIRLQQVERLAIPEGATSFVVKSGDSVTNPYSLSKSDGDFQFVQVNGTAGKRQFDITSAFTGRPKILYEIKVSAPLVFLQIADESQRDLAARLQKSLEAHGFAAPGVQNVAGKGFIPDSVEVRYLRYPEDKVEAEAVLQILKREYRMTNCRISYTEKGPRGQPGQLEIWFSATITTDGP